MAQTVLPKVVRTGRCFLPFEKNEDEKSPLQWDKASPGDSFWRYAGARPKAGGWTEASAVGNNEWLSTKHC